MPAAKYLMRRLWAQLFLYFLNAHQSTQRGSKELMPKSSYSIMALNFRHLGMRLCSLREGLNRLNREGSVRKKKVQDCSGHGRTQSQP